MWERLVAELRDLLAEENPYLLRPPTNMARLRKSSIGKAPKKPRKAGRLHIVRPHGRWKRRLTTMQLAAIKSQQAHKRGDVSGMRYWNGKYARHRQV